MNPSSKDEKNKDTPTREGMEQNYRKLVIQQRIKWDINGNWTFCSPNFLIENIFQLDETRLRSSNKCLSCNMRLFQFWQIILYYLIETLCCVFSQRELKRLVLILKLRLIFANLLPANLVVVQSCVRL